MINRTIDFLNEIVRNRGKYSLGLIALIVPFALAQGAMLIGANLYAMRVISSSSLVSCVDKAGFICAILSLCAIFFGGVAAKNGELKRKGESKTTDST